MTRFVLLLALLAAAPPGSVSSQRAPSPYGADLRLALRDGTRMRGELLAVQRDTLMLLYQRRVVAMPLHEVAEARVPQDGLTGRKVLLWTLMGGGLSAVGMTVACMQLDDSECGPVIPAVGLAWGVFGGISALVSGSGTRRVQAGSSWLNPYARFPQGMPPSFEPSETPEAESPRNGDIDRSGSPIKLLPQR